MSISERSPRRETMRRSPTFPPSGAPRSERAQTEQVQDRAIVSLFWRVFLLNAALLVAAGVALAVSPIEISTPTRVVEEAVLAAGSSCCCAANYVLLRPAFAPLERLAERMRDVDLLRPGRRLAADRLVGGGRARPLVQRDAGPARGGASRERPAGAGGTGGRAEADRGRAARRGRPDDDRRAAPARTGRG